MSSCVQDRLGEGNIGIKQSCVGNSLVLDEITTATCVCVYFYGHDDDKVTSRGQRLYCLKIEIDCERTAEVSRWLCIVAQKKITFYDLLRRKIMFVILTFNQWQEMSNQSYL